MSDPQRPAEEELSPSSHLFVPRYRRLYVGCNHFSRFSPVMNRGEATRSASHCLVAGCQLHLHCSGKAHVAHWMRLAAVLRLIFPPIVLTSPIECLKCLMITRRCLLSNIWTLKGDPVMIFFPVNSYWKCLGPPEYEGGPVLRSAIVFKDTIWNSLLGVGMQIWIRALIKALTSTWWVGISHFLLF